MKYLSRIILGLALTAPLAISSAVRADDKSATTDKNKQDVTMEQLPKAVKATVQREGKGKPPQSIAKSTDKNGAVAYEIKYLDGGKETTIDVATDGKVMNKQVRTVGTEPGQSNDTKSNEMKPDHSKHGDTKPSDTPPPAPQPPRP